MPWMNDKKKRKGKRILPAAKGARNRTTSTATMQRTCACLRMGLSPRSAPSPGLCGKHIKHQMNNTETAIPHCRANKLPTRLHTMYYRVYSAGVQSMAGIARLDHRYMLAKRHVCAHSDDGAGFSPRSPPWLLNYYIQARQEAL